MAADSAPTLGHPSTARPPRAAGLASQPAATPPPVSPTPSCRRPDTLTMLGEDIEAGLGGAPRQVPPAAGGPGGAAAPDPAGLRLLKPRSLPDAAHLLPHPCARVLPRPRRSLVTFLLCSGFGLLALLRLPLPSPGPGPDRPRRPRLRTGTPHGGRRAASRRLTEPPFPSPSRRSAPPTPPPPPPPSLNHRALGKRGAERLPPPTRPVTSATPREGFPAAPPRPARHRPRPAPPRPARAAPASTPGGSPSAHLVGTSTAASGLSAPLPLPGTSASDV